MADYYVPASGAVDGAVVVTQTGHTSIIIPLGSKKVEYIFIKSQGSGPNFTVSSGLANPQYATFYGIDGGLGLSNVIGSSANTTVAISGKILTWSGNIVNDGVIEVWGY